MCRYRVREVGAEINRGVHHPIVKPEIRSRYEATTEQTHMGSWVD